MTSLPVIAVISFYVLLNTSCNSKTKTETSTINLQDSVIITEVYQECLFVIKTSEETVTRGTAIQTKNLARRTIEASARLKIELEKLAGKRTMKLPLDMSEAQIINWRMLVGRKSWELDKKYLELLEKSNLKIKDLLIRGSKSQEQDLRKIATGFATVGDSSKNLITELRQKVEARTQSYTTDKQVSYQ